MRTFEQRLLVQRERNRLRTVARWCGVVAVSLVVLVAVVAVAWVGEALCG